MTARRLPCFAPEGMAGTIARGDRSRATDTGRKTNRATLLICNVCTCCDSTRSHGPRGNAVRDALRRLSVRRTRTRSVQDGIPTGTVGTRVTAEGQFPRTNPGQGMRRYDLKSTETPVLTTSPNEANALGHLPRTNPGQEMTRYLPESTAGGCPLSSPNEASRHSGSRGLFYETKPAAILAAGGDWTKRNQFPRRSRVGAADGGPEVGSPPSREISGRILENRFYLFDDR